MMKAMAVLTVTALFYGLFKCLLCSFDLTKEQEVKKLVIIQTYNHCGNKIT
jgi:hypothetical protein